MKRLDLLSVVIAATCLTYLACTNINSPCRADDGPVVAQPQADAAQAVIQPPTEPEPKPMSREVFSQLLEQKEFAQALTRLEAMIENQVNPNETFGMSMMLSVTLGRETSDQAREVLHAIVDRSRAKDSWDASTAIGVAYAVDSLINRDQTLAVEDKLAMLDWLKSKLPKDEPRLTMLQRMTLFRRISLLNNANRKEEAAAELNQMVDQARSKLDPNDGPSINEFIDAVSTYQSLSGSLQADRVAAVIGEATQLVTDAIKRPEANLQIYTAYFKLKLSVASAASRKAPLAAAEILDDLEQKLDEASEKLGQSDAQAIASYGRSISSLRSRIEAALKIEKMIGTEAPEIDASHFVAQSPVTMSDLRGKVVLIDFWAIWCGPCIATFPHLIDWHEKYADRGLVILGATRFYNYKWDDEAGRPVRGDQVSEDDEIAMLENFRQLHKLHHGFFITPADSDYQKKFNVTGIPQAVLIDKSGKIALVRIGSGEENARDIESKVQELLAAEP